MDDVCREPWPTLSSLSFVIRLNLSNSCPPLFVFSLLGFFCFFFLMVFYLILILNSPVESAHFSLIALVVNVFELISHFFFLRSLVVLGRTVVTLVYQSSFLFILVILH